MNAGGFGASTTPTPAVPAEPDRTHPVEPQPATPVAGGSYVVVKGDSLWKISQKFYGTGTKYDLIYDANRDKIRNPNAIFIGQELVIPEDE